jgi:ergothioneine biosynthesis glutamate--cysteine ligase EgtA
VTVIYEEQAAEHIHGICLKTGPPRLVGVELEWLVRDAHDPALPVSAERIRDAVAAFVPAAGLPSSGLSSAPMLPSNGSPGVLPSGAFLTAEPGGQLELSSQPADSLADCVRATTADLAALRATLGAADLELAGIGLDPLRPPRRILDLPRYSAMEGFFDRGGPWGRQMMCTTASVQVCLDAGDDSDGYLGYRWRWHLLHAIGPVLVAAFANSPLRGGRPTGWQSSRQQVWAHMDPGRTRPPRLDGDRLNGAPSEGHLRDPRAAWVEYVLDAQVMCVREPDSDDWSAPPGLTLRDWVRGRPRNNHAMNGGTRLRAPTADDLAYHVSTLFPPVRPHGHLELRMIDAQPGDDWIVPLAVTSALLGDERASAAAMAAADRLWAGHGRVGEWSRTTGRLARPGAGSGSGSGSGTEAGAENPWPRAARLGPADPAIARASRDCFAAARAALDRMGAPTEITTAVDAFIERYVSKDRCPADDLLEEVR